MTPENARKITSACMAHVWYREGLSDQIPPSLAEYSLRDLLEANEFIAANSEIRHEDGSTSLMLHCDQRLVAALYVAYHYPPDDPQDCMPVAYGPTSAVLIVRAPK